MLWETLLTTSIAAGTAQSANATTVATMVATLFGYPAPAVVP